MVLIGQKSKHKYSTSLPIWRGINDELLDLELEDLPNKNLVNKKFSGLWRYRNFISIDNSRNIVTLNEGYTPLIEVKINRKKAFIKLEQLSVSGSYKDRGASVLISKVKELGLKYVVQDSSGNAGASIAIYSALANLKCDIYVPKYTSGSKVAQIKASGANLKIVNGNRDYTAQVAFKAAKKSYYASHCYNPFFLEGTKTFLFEVFEQLKFKMPEAIILPAGNGTLLLGCYIGIKQLLKVGLVQKIPKLIAVQATNCSPLYNLINHVSSNFTETIAEGIAIAKPIRLQQMADAINFTNGLVITVTEKEITKMWLNLAKQGFMVEPTSAATIAGLDFYMQNYVTNGPVVSLFSGHGLKATDKWIKYLNL